MLVVRKNGVREGRSLVVVVEKVMGFSTSNNDSSGQRDDGW